MWETDDLFFHVLTHTTLELKEVYIFVISFLFSLFSWAKFDFHCKNVSDSATDDVEANKKPLLDHCAWFAIILLAAQQHIQAIISAQILPKCFLFS